MAGALTNGARAIREEDPLPPDDLVLRPVANSDIIERLYRAEAPRLLRRLARKASSPDEAEDQLQEIFYRLARLGQRLGSIERPQAYLRRVAANLATDQAKQAVRQAHSLHIVANEEQLPGTDQRRLLESRDMLNRIEAAMKRLRPRTREIFMAHRIDGLTYAEIARRNGLTVKGVEKQMSKALRQIDRMLDRS